MISPDTLRKYYRRVEADEVLSQHIKVDADVYTLRSKAGAEDESLLRRASRDATRKGVQMFNSCRARLRELLEER